MSQRGPYRKRFPGYHRWPIPTLGPCRCDHCGEPLFWAKRLTRVLGIAQYRFGWREDDGTLHRCPNFDRLPVVRARATRYNTGVGSSDESNRLANGTRASATTGGAGVVSSIEVVAR